MPKKGSLFTDEADAKLPDRIIENDPRVSKEMLASGYLKVGMHPPKGQDFQLWLKNAEANFPAWQQQQHVPDPHLNVHHMQALMKQFPGVMVNVSAGNPVSPYIIQGHIDVVWGQGNFQEPHLAKLRDILDYERQVFNVNRQNLSIKRDFSVLVALTVDTLTHIVSRSDREVKSEEMKLLSELLIELQQLNSTEPNLHTVFMQCDQTNYPRLLSSWMAALSLMQVPRFEVAFAEQDQRSDGDKKSQDTAVYLQTLNAQLAEMFFAFLNDDRCTIPPRLVGNHMRGDDFYRRGDYTEACKFYRRAIDLYDGRQFPEKPQFILFPLLMRGNLLVAGMKILTQQAEVEVLSVHDKQRLVADFSKLVVEIAPLVDAMAGYPGTANISSTIDTVDVALTDIIALLKRGILYELESQDYADTFLKCANLASNLYSKPGICRHFSPTELAPRKKKMDQYYGEAVALSVMLKREQKKKDEEETRKREAEQNVLDEARADADAQADALVKEEEALAAKRKEKEVKKRRLEEERDRVFQEVQERKRAELQNVVEAAERIRLAQQEEAAKKEESSAEPVASYDDRFKSQQVRFLAIINAKGASFIDDLDSVGEELAAITKKAKKNPWIHFQALSLLADVMVVKAEHYLVSGDVEQALKCFAAAIRYLDGREIKPYFSHIGLNVSGNASTIARKVLAIHNVADDQQKACGFLPTEIEHLCSRIKAHQQYALQMLELSGGHTQVSASAEPLQRAVKERTVEFSQDRAKAVICKGLKVASSDDDAMQDFLAAKGCRHFPVVPKGSWDDIIARLSATLLREENEGKWQFDKAPTDDDTALLLWCQHVWTAKSRSKGRQAVDEQSEPHVVDTESKAFYASMCGRFDEFIRTLEATRVPPVGAFRS